MKTSSSPAHSFTHRRVYSRAATSSTANEKSTMLTMTSRLPLVTGSV
jgi:hypothetical protein